jgi:hypothetical protein
MDALRRHIHFGQWGRLLPDGAAVFASNAQMLLAMVDT